MRSRWTREWSTEVKKNMRWMCGLRAFTQISINGWRVCDRYISYLHGIDFILLFSITNNQKKRQSEKNPFGKFEYRTRTKFNDFFPQTIAELRNETQVGRKVSHFTFKKNKFHCILWVKLENEKSDRNRIWSSMCFSFSSGILHLQVYYVRTWIHESEGSTGHSIERTISAHNAISMIRGIGRQGCRTSATNEE